MYLLHTPLRLQNKKWHPVFFLFAIVTVAVLWFSFPGGQRPELLISYVGAAAGFSYFLYRQHLDETKLFKELFVEFNKRYDSLNERLNAIRCASPNCVLSTQDEDVLFSYFNLCAEEYFFYQAGYIDQNVWESWKRGMDQFFEQRSIRSLWETERESNSYYGFSPD